MIEPRQFFEVLRSKQVDFFAGVPDSLLKSFCTYVDDQAEAGQHIITANEGSAIGLATGYHLATGKMALVYMQNSGLGNAVNPLTSLADPAVYSIPMILLIGWRGEPNVHDEPQHVKMGEVTLKVLEAIDVPYRVLSDNPDEAMAEVEQVCELAKKESRPYALVARKKTFAPYQSEKKSSVGASELTREEAVTIVTSLLEPQAAIVSTTGKLSRELFEIRERRGEGHDHDFLTVGSMGHASQIALGLALAKPDRPIYCFDGDGAALMHLGGLAIIGQQAPANLRHIVFNNGMHESVGGQRTVALDIDLGAIARACGYQSVRLAEDKDQLEKALAEMKQSAGPTFLEIRLRGGAREDLGRPTRTPQENKADFEAFINGN